MAAGGGVFQSENGTKVQLPGANLNDIANQADDLLEVITVKTLDSSFFYFLEHRWSIWSYTISFKEHVAHLG